MGLDDALGDVQAQAVAGGIVFLNVPEPLEDPRLDIGPQRAEGERPLRRAAPTGSAVGRAWVAMFSAAKHRPQSRRASSSAHIPDSSP